MFVCSRNAGGVCISGCCLFPGVLPNISYVPPQRVWFLSGRFGLKTGIDFEHFARKLGMFRLLV